MVENSRLLIRINKSLPGQIEPRRRSSRFRCGWQRFVLPVSELIRAKRSAVTVLSRSISPNELGEGFESLPKSVTVLSRFFCLDVSQYLLRLTMPSQQCGAGLLVGRLLFPILTADLFILLD